VRREDDSAAARRFVAAALPGCGKWLLELMIEVFESAVA
jgi:hypothetical protein